MKKFAEKVSLEVDATAGNCVLSVDWIKQNLIHKSELGLHFELQNLPIVLFKSPGGLKKSVCLTHSRSSDETHCLLLID